MVANRIHPNAAMMWLAVGAIQVLMLILAGMLTFGDSTLHSLGVPSVPLWLVLGLLVVLDAGVILVVALSWLRVTYVIRPDEIVIQRGLLRVDERIYQTGRVETIEIEESFWGRRFNYGNIIMSGPGFPEPLELLGVTDPEHYVKIIRKAV